MSPLVPYGFARMQRVLPAGEQDGRLVVWVTDDTPCAAIAELRRALSRDLVPVIVSSAQFEEGLRAAFADGEGQAAAVVGEVESEADLERLMQDIPEVEDLLDARNDAPVIRMLNALFSQALR